MGIRLHSGDRVCIVGGGPAGSISALHLLRLAREERLDLAVDIYEPRDFYSAGATHNCKGCAGILSAGALRSLSLLGLAIPPDVVQSRLSAYLLHVPGRQVVIEQPVTGREILSVYRGTGPRRHRGPDLRSFDGYLLGAAVAAGARHVRARVRRVTWEGGPVVHTDRGSASAEFLVLATGVNSRSPLDAAFGYHPPQSAVMAQDEIRRPPDWPEGRVGGFFGRPRELLFGALVPKGDYLNVSLLWRGPAANAVQQFYQAHASALLPYFTEQPQSYCGCCPRILTGPAEVYYGDRWVAVGDAVVAHLYKDGIKSAFVTAEAAISTAVRLGIDTATFAQAYRPVCRQIANDNRYGAFLYTVCAQLLRSERVATAFAEAVHAEMGLGAGRQLHARLLWGMLTGDEPYRALFRLLLQPRGFIGFARQVVRPLAVPGRSE